jgi:hypothetical protein
MISLTVCLELYKKSKVQDCEKCNGGSSAKVEEAVTGLPNVICLEFCDAAAGKVLLPTEGADLEVLLDKDYANTLNSLQGSKATLYDLAAVIVHDDDGFVLCSCCSTSDTNILPHRVDRYSTYRRGAREKWFHVRGEQVSEVTKDVVQKPRCKLAFFVRQLFVLPKSL